MSNKRTPMLKLVGLSKNLSPTNLVKENTALTHNSDKHITIDNIRDVLTRMYDYVEPQRHPTNGMYSVKETLHRPMQIPEFKAVHDLVRWWTPARIANINFVKLPDDFKETVPGFMLPLLKKKFGIQYEEWDKTELEFKMALPLSFEGLLMEGLKLNDDNTILDHFRAGNKRSGNSLVRLTHANMTNLFSVVPEERAARRVLGIIASGIYESTDYNVTNFDNWDSSEVYVPKEYGAIYEEAHLPY